MDLRQDKQHALLQTILDEATSELPADMVELNINEFPTSLEFEATLRSLIELGDQHHASSQFWWNLKTAAELLDLHDLYAPLRQRRLNAPS